MESWITIWFQDLIFLDIFISSCPSLRSSSFQMSFFCPCLVDFAAWLEIRTSITCFLLFLLNETWHRLPRSTHSSPCRLPTITAFPDLPSRAHRRSPAQDQSVWTSMSNVIPTVCSSIQYIPASCNIVCVLCVSKCEWILTVHSHFCHSCVSLILFQPFKGD